MLPRLVNACTVAAVLIAVAGMPDPDASERTAIPEQRIAAASVPTVLPTPQRITRIGPDVALRAPVRVVDGAHTDPAALDLLLELLERRGIAVSQADDDAAGSVDVESAVPAVSGSTIRLGAVDRPDVARGLGDVDVPDADEAYALRVGRHRGAAEVSIGGTDPAGQYYGVRTFDQLLDQPDQSGQADQAGSTGSTDRTGAWSRVAAVAVSDHPSMPLRGTIEGFYGSPWTHAERMDQLAFYGEVKANTYVYAPKDDPYHRERWREPYPPEELSELGDLVEQARAHHVRFTFALSPGTSICYADPADRKALSAKLGAMYDLGIRSFSIPLDDIDYTNWNCPADRDRYGAPGRQAAARAQVELLNQVQAEFVTDRPGVQPLQMVPTEYGDLEDSPYKRWFRANLDQRIEVMWTGTDVVPPSITIEQADQIARLYGRNVFVWDNYPVNDFEQSAGRLLLAPYDHREPGLSDHLSGLVSNPMNQAAASKVAVGTMADFAWNDRDYDRDRSWRAMAERIAAGDPAGTRALLVFFDLNHLAPTFGTEPWQPQAPELERLLDRFWQRYAPDGSPDAVRDLERYLQRIEQAPAQIRETVPDEGFLRDAANWLDATELWGGAALGATDLLTAIERDDQAAAQQARERMERLATEAAAIRSVPGENRVEGPVRIGDGVLDAFLEEVGTRHDAWTE